MLAAKAFGTHTVQEILNGTVIALKFVSCFRLMDRIDVYKAIKKWHFILQLRHVMVKDRLKA